MISRLKQAFRYLFFKFDKNSEKEVREFLSQDEFQIFNEMSEYDRLHSFLIYKAVQKNEILKSEERYLKLALLHDCAKGKVTFYRRAKKVMIGDEKLEQHPENAYQKLKNIDIELAKLCREHHKKKVGEMMKIFQQIDDE